MTMVPLVLSEEWDEPYPLPFLSVVSGRVKLFGFNIEETSGVASARAVIYDGQDQTPTNFLPIRLGAGESTGDWFGPQGITFRIGILPVVTSGTVAGNLLIAHRRDQAG